MPVNIKKLVPYRRNCGFLRCSVNMNELRLHIYLNVIFINNIYNIYNLLKISIV